MKCAIVGAAVLALCLTSGMAAAENIPSGGMTAQDVADWLHSKGYKADIQRMDSGKPKIASATQGVNFFIHFYDCKNERCASIQFVAGFSTEGTYSLEKANSWNSDNRWITASMDKENDPWVSMDVDLWPGGTYELLNDELQVWNDSITRFMPTIKR